MSGFTQALVNPKEELAKPRELEGTARVEDLKTHIEEWTRNGRIYKSDMPITVQGVFLPCVLLSTGWWERRRQAQNANLPAWRDKVQEWLFRGFDLWAPSWDLSLATEAESGAVTHLAGQLGSGDEADSMPVLIHQRKAIDIRAELQAGRTVMDASVSGILRHISQLGPAEAAALQTSTTTHSTDTGSADYCLLVYDEVPIHNVFLKSRPPDLYSGYLWQCWGPRECAPAPRLQDVYFVWEHTNFSDPDCISFNLEALTHKVRRLVRRINDPVLLQKSHSWLMNGEAALSASQFYELLFGHGRANSPI